MDVVDSTGLIVARGRVSACSDEISLACGLTSDELSANRILARLADRPIMHRDELIVFE